jgi:hypothetical protein
MVADAARSLAKAMRPESASLRRPYIYPHRSARMLRRVSRRFAAAVARRSF